jgi:hypothetical protein
MGQTNKRANSPVNKRESNGLKRDIKQGFLLCELLVYSALFSLVIMYIFSFVAHHSLLFSCVQRVCAWRLRNERALDALRHDFMSAVSDYTQWDESSGIFTQEYINRKGRLETHSIGWEITEKGLVRCEGAYDFTQHSWRSCVKSLVSCDISDIKIKPQIQEYQSPPVKRVVGVQVMYKLKSCDSKNKMGEQDNNLWVRVRNGVC